MQKHTILACHICKGRKDSVSTLIMDWVENTRIHAVQRASPDFFIHFSPDECPFSQNILTGELAMVACTVHRMTQYHIL